MTDFQVHDLLRIDPACLTSVQDVPAWATEALRDYPWVVVRREAPAQPGHLPVGVRGAERGQRFAMKLPTTAVLERRTPASLTAAIHRGLRTSPLPALASLPDLANILNDWRWGPGGSVAFHLATGAPCVHRESDLDLVLYVDELISRAEAVTLLQTLRRSIGSADVLIETSEGAYALEEYATGKTWICRTPSGPKLCQLSA